MLNIRSKIWWPCLSSWLTFLLGFQTVTLVVLLFWIYSFFLCLYLFYNSFPSIGKFWSCCLSFHWISNKLKAGCLVSCPVFILVFIGIVFVIIWKMFHGRISLNSVLLLLLVKFVRGFRLELLYISLIISIKSNFTHLHDFQQLLPLP